MLVGRTRVLEGQQVESIDYPKELKLKVNKWGNTTVPHKRLLEYEVDAFQIDAEILILYISVPLGLVALLPKIQISKLTSSVCSW